MYRRTLHSLLWPYQKQSNPLIIFLSNTDFFIILPSLQHGSSQTGFLSKLSIPFFSTICMLHATLCVMLIISGKSNSHEAHYIIFYIPLFLPPSHIQYSPHPPAVTNPQSVFFSWCKTPNFTPTQNDRNNVSFIYQHMQHSELNGSRYCLHLFCYFLFQDRSFSIFLRT